MIIKIESVTQSVYCKCGTKLIVTGADVRMAIKAFSDAHFGEGHAPVTADEFREIKKSKWINDNWNRLTDNGQGELPW